MIKITTDNKWRTFKCGYELPKKWRQEKDWLKGDKFDEANFAYYQQWYFAVDEFMRFSTGATQST